MRFVILSLVFGFGMVGQSPLAQEPTRIRAENIPGKLESFLIATPNASLNRRVMGTLEFPGKATFTAIIATDPGMQGREKGLEVRVEEGSIKAIVYLDDDCLKRLEKSLPSLLEDQQYMSDHLKEYSSRDLAIPHAIALYNQVPGSDEHAEKAGIMDVGFYGHDEGFGVYLRIPWGRIHPSGQFYFPRARLIDLLKIIQATNVFLAAS
jgi:hypothetical protein